MFDTRVTVHFVGQRVEIPRLAASFAIVLTAQIEDLMLESFVTVPAVPGENATVFHDDPMLAFVDPKEGDVVGSIT